MKRVGLVLLVIFLFVTIIYAQDESITITTYYPAPYGVYKLINVTDGYQKDGFLILTASHTNSNIFLGEGAGINNTTGTSNTFLGNHAGEKNTSGMTNTFIGHSAGLENTTGMDNTLIGWCAGEHNTTGGSCTFLGYGAGFNNTTAFDNTFIGGSAGYNNTTGHDNVFLGNSAGCSNTTGQSNVFLGSFAGCYSNSTEGYNTFVGCNAGYAPDTTEGLTGQYNTFIGYQTGSKNTTGNYNTFLGSTAGNSNTTGIQNICLGYQAGFSNQSGGNNVFIGYQAGYNETESNKLYIANSNTTTPLIYGDFSAGNIGIRTTEFGSGEGVLSLGNVTTSPLATLSNAALFYARGGEMYVMDATGNKTLLSPHDPKTGEWIFYSKNTKTGRVMRVDMERLVKKIEELTGEKFLFEDFEKRD